MEQITRGRKWIKLWVDEYLMGTTRFELTPEERAVWVDLLALAGKSREEGKIYAGKYDSGYRGYPLDYLAGILVVPPKVLQLTLEKCQKYEKIRVLHDEHNNLIIEILNWEKYQSEYNRQKKYRLQKKNKKVTQEVTKKLHIEEEGEVEGEVEGGVKEDKSNILSEKTPEEDFFLTLSKRTFSSVSDFSEIREYLKTTSLINRNGKIDEELLDKIIEGLQAFPLSRRSGRMKGSHIAKFLQAIQKFHPDAVFDGIAIYLEKHCENKSLTEKYCLGIIRNEQRRIEFELKKEGKK